jgi:hypothetical protein
VAGAAHVAGPSLLEALEGADLVGHGVFLGDIAGAVIVAELVIEAFGREIDFLLGDPFLQPEVR